VGLLALAAGAVGLFAVMENLSLGHIEGPYGHYMRCCNNLKNISTALEMYTTDDAAKAYPPRLALLTPNYLKTIPTCAIASQDTYSAAYQTTGREYTVYCNGSYHALLFVRPDHPAATSHNGVDRGENRPPLLVRMWLYVTGHYPSEGHPYQAD
jgi:hypothetical protein